MPGWGEDERLRRFYESCFRGDTIHEIGEFKPYASDGSEFAHRLQVSLEYLLEQQPASTKDWLGLTGFQFFSEGELYGFLLDVYHYFYGDRAEPPSAPDPDRPPPGNQDQFWTEWR
ncbi:hypothetical protein SAMN05428945_1965 [Streptomyces sp. 2224.1]|nr:hypothetical protein BX261_3339 [Streptomyces sp. 2321.6]SDR42787.1 hypothetical protein SAMN05216511_3862 [Streptomyces sp. KS_16]SEC07822.1 hypothetical protein SAMN05428945_1965 [Streptomyces sp. 2224.1]SEC95161.1 hypothetical protein SAMN05428940_3342 [Streptomyces sp. 2133.1]SNC69473.1 hypothetical protein SAMN06272741_3333 [Streptomyces sp. 2114.4]